MTFKNAISYELRTCYEKCRSKTPIVFLSFLSSKITWGNELNWFKYTFFSFLGLNCQKSSYLWRDNREDLLLGLNAFVAFENCNASLHILFIKVLLRFNQLYLRIKCIKLNCLAFLSLKWPFIEQHGNRIELNLTSSTSIKIIFWKFGEEQFTVHKITNSPPWFLVDSLLCVIICYAVFVVGIFFSLC